MQKIFLSFVLIIISLYGLSQAQYQPLYSKYNDSIFSPKIENAISKIKNIDSILLYSTQAFNFYVERAEYNRAMYLMQKGAIHSVFKQPKATSDKVDSCLRIIRPLIDTNNVHFATLMEAEAFAYRIKRDMDVAVELYLNIKKIYNVCSAPKILLYGIYQTLGSIYIEKGKYYEGFMMYKEGLPYFRKEDDKGQLSFTYNEMANALQFTHQYDFALELRIKSLEITQASDPGFYNHAIFANNVANSYSDMGEYEKSIYWANYADSVMHHYGQTDELIYYYITALELRQVSYFNLKQYDKSMGYAEQIGATIKQYFGAKSEFMSDYYLIKHSIFLEQNKYDSAFKFLETVKSINPSFAPLNRLYGEYYYKKGDYDTAIYYAKQSCAQYIEDSSFVITDNIIPSARLFSNNTWASISGVEQQSELNSDIGNIVRYSIDAYKKDNNNTYLEECISYACLLDTLMAKSRDLALLGSEALQLASNYHSLAATTLEANTIAYKHSNKPKYLDNCVNFIAQSASYSLNSQVAQMGGQSVQLDKIKAKQQIELMLIIQQKENELLAAKNNSDSILINRISEDLLNTKLDAFELTAEMQSLVAKNNNNNSLSDININIKTIQSLLKPNEAVISYFLDDSTLYSLFISNNNALINTIPNNKTLKSSIKEYYRNLKTSSSNFASSAKNLYDILLGKYSKILKNITKLNIIADGELSQIPFESLIVPTEKNKKYLIEMMSVNYSNSLYLWKNNRENLKPTNIKELSFVGIAPVFSKTPVLLEKSSPIIADAQMRGDFADLRSGNKLKPLPFTEIEVNSIKKLFHKNGNIAKSYLYKDANEKNFKNNIVDFNIIHVATHGYASKKEPELSGLFFNKPLNIDSSDITNDGFLYLGEIYNLKINADLVVLSACKSGSGKIEEGEGIIALPRAFIFNGVPNIISSLWKIHDKKTAAFMLYFYKNILKGNSYAKSLQLTKINMIENKELPVDWSGLVINGTGL